MIDNWILCIFDKSFLRVTKLLPWTSHQKSKNKTINITKVNSLLPYLTDIDFFFFLYHHLLGLFCMQPNIFMQLSVLSLDVF